jgi:DNA polymerase-1
MSTLLFDIETDGLLAEVTKIHCLVIMDADTKHVSKYTANPGPGEDPIDVGLLLLQSAERIVGHNVVRFDIPVIQKFYPWFQPRGIVRDTLISAKLIWPNLKTLDKGSRVITGKLVGSHALKAWGLRLGALKGDFGETSDWKVFTPEMLEYCVQDVVGPTDALWTLILKKNYSEEAIQNEHDFAFVAFQMEQHGFAFDEKAAAQLHVQLVKRRLELEAQLQEKYKGWWEDMKMPDHYLGEVMVETRADVKSLETFKYPTKGAAQKAKATNIRPGPLRRKHTPFNPGSRDHIIKVLLSDHGWKPTKFTDGGDPKLDEEVLEALDLPEAKLLIEYLMLQKRLGQLAEGDNAWLKLVKNGRIHGRIDPMGTVTSRCSHSAPNMGQCPAVDKPFGKECRALFTANPGHVLVGADASGIQLRVVAHYAALWDGGEYVQLVTKGDVHTANKEAAGLDTRDRAKTFIYAWLLGGGDAKIGAITGKGAAVGKALKAAFLSRFPALKAIKDALKQAIDESGTIRGLDGRIMPCESAHLAMGSLLQGFEAVIMKKASWFLYQDLTSRGWVHGKDWGLCAFVHDEWQISARPEIADEIGKAATAAIVKAGEYFKSRCPLAGEFKIGRNWAETH